MIIPSLVSSSTNVLYGTSESSEVSLVSSRIGEEIPVNCEKQS